MNTRRYVPAGLALIITLGIVGAATSEPGTGTRVPTLEEFNSLEGRVTTLENRPTPTVTATATATTTVTQTATPTPTPTPTPQPAAFPTVDNTGVPAGTNLTAYTGPMTISTANTVVRDKIVTGTLVIAASGVQIINSRINGSVDLRNPTTSSASFTITDSEVHVGDVMRTGIMRGNFTATRVEITGGNRSIYCESDCTVVDSLVHKQATDEGGSTHFSGVRMSQNLVLRHNTVICEAGRGPGTGCSAALTGYGDFAPVQNNLIERNQFIGHLGGGATLCVYGGSSGDDGSKPYGAQARDIRFLNNTFVRGGPTRECGNLGAVGSFDPTRPGNVWSGNVWDTGGTVNHTD